MGKTCAIWGCLSTSRYEKDRHFFRFPTNAIRCKKWIEASGRPELREKSIEALRNNYFVCDIHFQASERLLRKLRHFAVPTLNLPSPEENGNPSRTTQTEFEYIPIKFIPQNDASTQIAIAVTSHATQTKQEISADTPRIKQLKAELKAEVKKRVILESEKQYLSFSGNISPELRKLINIQKKLERNSSGNRYTTELKLFALSLYTSSPKAYRVLSSILSLPSERTLRRMNLIIGTKLNSNVLQCLNTKIKNLNDTEKSCIICADKVPLKRNFYYQINEDNILGFHEIDGVQTKEPATQAFVVMIKGVFSNWKQQIGYCLLAENKYYKELNEWLNDVISTVINIGFNVVAFVSDLDSISLEMANQRGVLVETPYFYVNRSKIHFIFDVPNLIKTLRNDLMKHDFEFLDIDKTKHTAKWEDIQNFYIEDSKRRLRLAPKLTESHINPNNFERNELTTATDVFSNTVAAAMNFYIEYGRLEKSSIGTVHLIDLIDKTCNVLNSSILDDSKKYERFENFLSTVVVLNKNKMDVTKSITCLTGFKISLESFKGLAKDLKADSFRSLNTKKINKAQSDCISGRQQTRNARKLTPLMFTRAFRRLFRTDMLRHSKSANSTDDFEKLLTAPDNVGANKDELNNLLPVNDTKMQAIFSTGSLAVTVGTVDYRFELPEEHAFDYVCGYLLRKCFEIHKCKAMCIFVKQCETHPSGSTSNKSPLSLKPPSIFVNYVKRMDNRLKHYLQQNVPDRVGNNILTEMSSINFIDRCECFPNVYLKKLFVRFRIYNIIQSNNRSFKDKSFKYFSVADI